MGMREGISNLPEEVEVVLRVLAIETECPPHHNPQAEILKGHTGKLVLSILGGKKRETCPASA
jgi:hypothetical protein